MAYHGLDRFPRRPETGREGRIDGSRHAYEHDRALRISALPRYVESTSASSSVLVTDPSQIEGSCSV